VVKCVLKWAQGFIAVVGRALARLWARGKYFQQRDLQSLQAGRIALVACHWLGDTFWASQVVPVLRRRFPHSLIYAVTKPHSVDLWAGLVPPERVIRAEEIVSDRHREPVRWLRLVRLAGRLRRQRFDLIIDLTGNRYSALATFLARPEFSIGFAGDEVGWLYSYFVADARRTDAHLSGQPFRVIRPLLDPSALPAAGETVLRPPEATCSGEEMLAALGIRAGRVFVIAPGAGWPAKQWPAERFVATGSILARGGAAVVVVGAAGEWALCNRVAAGIAGAKVLCGEPIGRVVALLGEAAGVLANDSAIGHFAAALGRPTAVVFTGATDPALCRPLGPSERVKIFSAEAVPAEIAAYLQEVSDA